MATLQIKKKTLRTWEHIDSQLGMFILSKFYFSADGTKFQVVEQGQAKRRIYDITQIEVFDVGGPAETFGTITALSIRLEELKYPAYNLGGVFEFDPADYDLEEFNNDGADPYAHLSDIVDASIELLKTNITSSDLSTLDESGISAYINALASSFAVASNQIQRFKVTDTGQIFELQLNNRSFGGAEPDITASDVLMLRSFTFDTLHRHFSEWQVIGTSSTVVNVLNGNAMATSGTLAAVALNLDTPISSIPFVSTTGVTTANTSAYFKETSNFNTSLIQGFDYIIRFGINDTNSTTARTFVGLFGTTAVPSNTIDPSAYAFPNVGIGNDSGDANLFIMHNDNSGTSTKVPLGASFPAHTTTDAYELRLMSLPVSNSANAIIHWAVRNIITGVTAGGKITTDLPRNTTTGVSSLTHVVLRNNGANTVAPSIKISKISFVRLN